MTLLAIDPGRSKLLKTIGYSIWWTSRVSQPAEVERGEMSWDDLCKGLFYRDDEFSDTGSGLIFRGERIDEVVIENFINNARSRGGQTNGTSEVIGAVEILCVQSDTPFTRQPNTILPVAKLQAGYVDTHQHLPHQDAAYLHGYYYLVSKGVLRSKRIESTIHPNRSQEES